MITIPISSPEVTIETAGGKGASLAHLARLGMPVPPGFVLTTDAYRHFVAANGLDRIIAECVGIESPDDMEALERASARIRAGFSAGKIPDEIEDAVKRELDSL